MEVGGSVQPGNRFVSFVRASERARRGEAAWASERGRFAPVARARRGQFSLVSRRPKRAGVVSGLSRGCFGVVSGLSRG